jgi:hypothetical protein
VPAEVENATYYAADWAGVDVRCTTVADTFIAGAILLNIKRKGDKGGLQEEGGVGSQGM